MGYFKDMDNHQLVFSATKFFAYVQDYFFKFLINIYLWRITNDFVFLIFYNIIFEISHIVTFISASKISKEYNRFLSLRIGLILQLLFLGSILYLKEGIVAYILPIAIIGGMAHGFYWCSDNLLKFDLTNTDNRLKFVSFYNILKSIAKAIIPLIASIIVIQHDKAISSYSLIFILSLIFTGLALLSTFFISKEKQASNEKYAPIKKSINLLKDKNIRIACISTFLSYIADILPMILGLMLFNSTGTELSIGGYQFITITIAVLLNYFVGIHFSKKDYKKMLIYGGIANFIFVFILLIRQDFIAILIYGILSSIVSVLTNPFYPLIQDSLNDYAKDEKHLLDIRVEFLTLIETFSVIGILTGLAIFSLIHYNLSFKSLVITIVVLAFADLISNIYITKIESKKSADIDSSL